MFDWHYYHYYHRNQATLLSAHSKWSAESNGTKDKFGGGGFKSSDQSVDKKRGENVWGPFKSREHFNEMHMF